MQIVHYRGGVVTFAIPDNWIEDTDPDDEAGIFFEDAPDAGVFRLSVTTARSPGPVTPEMVAELMAAFASEPGHTVEPLPNGNQLLHFRSDAHEEAKPLAIYFWLVGNPVPPDYARIANFSYTVHAEHADLPATQAVVAFLDQSIRSAMFSPTLGE
jgi:hypothetical protein